MIGYFTPGLLNKVCGRYVRSKQLSTIVSCLSFQTNVASGHSIPRSVWSLNTIHKCSPRIFNRYCRRSGLTTLESYSWPWIFFINIPVGIFLRSRLHFSGWECPRFFSLFSISCMSHRNDFFFLHAQEREGVTISVLSVHKRSFDRLY